MMIELVILNRGYSGAGEALFVGLCQGLLFGIIYAIYKFISGRRKQKAIEEYEETKATKFAKDNNVAYSRLIYNELIAKCNPKCFMDPYDYEKVKYANWLYPKIEGCSCDDFDRIRDLRHLAMVNLGIRFSTYSIYKLLCQECNPRKWMEPYNQEKVTIANEIYDKIQRNKNDIEVLEDIQEEAITKGLVEQKSVEPYEPESAPLGAWLFLFTFAIIIIIALYYLFR